MYSLKARPQDLTLEQLLRPPRGADAIITNETLARIDALVSSITSDPGLVGMCAAAGLSIIKPRPAAASAAAPAVTPSRPWHKKRCQEPECTAPALYGPLPSSDRVLPLRCFNHKQPGDIHHRSHRRCIAPNCTTQPTFGPPGTRLAWYCARHKAPGCTSARARDRALARARASPA